MTSWGMQEGIEIEGYGPRGLFFLLIVFQYFFNKETYLIELKYNFSKLLGTKPGI